MDSSGAEGGGVSSGGGMSPLKEDVNANNVSRSGEGF